MKISVRVKTGSKEECAEKIGANEYAVRVKTAPIEGRANRAAIKILSSFFGIPKTRFRLVSGHKSKNKIIEIL